MNERTTLSSEQDCADFVEGCLALGTGGGGSPDEGMATLREGLKRELEISWVDPATIADDALTVTAYASGSIAPRDPETDRLIRSLHLGVPQSIEDAMGAAIEALGAHLGRPVAAVVPVEIGASNSPGPLVAAARLGLPVPDGDYTGRAAPSEMQGAPFVHDVASDPFASVDQWGNTAIVSKVVNPYMLERMTKMLAIAGVDGTAIASTPLDGRDMKRILVPGTLTTALRIGRAARAAREGSDDPVDAVVDAARGWRLFDGTVTAKEWEDRDGYMFGTLVIRGRGPQGGGSELRLWFQNEIHVSWLDGEPWICSPDLVTVLDASTGVGHTSTDIAVGDRVSAVGMAGHPMFRTPEALRKGAGPEFFGFPDIGYRPIDELI